MRPAFPVFLLFITFACMKPNRTFVFSDGNSNLYTLDGSVLTYNPVKPEESSSGTYSGGEEKTVTLAGADVDSLRLLFEQAMANVTHHQPNRLKGTGVLTIRQGGEEKQCILKRGSPELEAIESFLKKHMN